MDFMDAFKNCLFITVESEATDENPFAENKIRMATKEEITERLKARLQDEEFIKMLEIYQDEIELSNKKYYQKYKEK
jgi:hypothetical protein